jgi:RHS repeat-associated protein
MLAAVPKNAPQGLRAPHARRVRRRCHASADRIKERRHRARNLATGQSEARFYDPIAGRFLSTDPVTANFNRYAYANNNPYKNIDPDGRYACTGTNIPSLCGDVAKAVDHLKDAVNSSKLSKNESRELKRVSNFIGTEGDGNKVIITEGDTSGAVGGTTSYDKKTGITTITLRPDKDIKNLGKNLTHEGSHGLTDSDRERMDNNRSERMENEVKAYTTQGYYQKALDYSTRSTDPWVYGSGMSEKNIINNAIQSVNNSCFGSSSGSCGD